MKYLKFFMMTLVVMVCTSCLENNLEELKTYTGNEITSIQGVYYRYYSSDIIDASGEQAVKQVSLNVSNTQKDAEAGTLNFNVSLPTNFPEEEKANVNAGNLVVVFNISTAAVIEPIGSSPKLGTPGDWSKPNEYRVKAADGNKKVWTVTMNFQ